MTGTPIDTTNSVAPVTFTVTVTGDAPTVDTDKLVADGIRGAQNYITENGLGDLAYGFEWSVFSMMRSGGTVPQSGIDAYLDSVEATYSPTPAVDSEEMNPTTLARVAIALGALGENAANFRGINFIKHLYSSDRIAAPAGTSNDASYALIAMDTQKYSVPTNAKWTRENLIHEILTYQNANGGFGLTDSTSVSADITAMALQALAPYYSSDPQVKEATDRAVAWLKGEMSADGIFAGTADSTAQVLTALAALGIDPADTESGFDGLLPGILSFQSANGGFNYGNKVNLMTTHQALYALEAYRRSVSGENALYDMTDAVTDPRAVLERRLAEANTLIEGDYTAESWAAMAEARAAAQDVFANESATADDLVAADAALKHAIAALVKESSSSGSDKNSISAYVTIIDKGKVVVPQLIVSVTDQNNSGGYDVDDALYAAHKATYPGGAANGYASYTGDYGLAISKLWGDTGYAYGYWLNNASCWSLADPIAAGDHLVAFVYQDGIGWSDAYSMFDRFDYTATADAALTVRTESAGYDESWNTVFSAFSAANITAYDDTFHTLTADKYTVVNHGDGSYSVTFDDTGFYYLVASCSDPLTVPAVSSITVSAAAGTPSRPDGKVDVVYIRVADPYGTTYLRKTTCEFEDGETAYSLLLKTGLSVDSRRSEYGVYVESIEGLGEFDEGSGSGWMYKVNGEFPGYSSALYDLSSGDYVEWVYTRDLGEDVGGSSSSGPKFAEEDRAVAREVKDLISAIGTVTKDSGDAIKAARAAYDALTDTQKDLVPNYDDLITAEKKYAELTKDEQVFADVSEDAYYYEAVKWAMEKGITSGTSETTFSPNASCTRAQMVAFLWRAAGSPKTAATTCNFTDIAKDAYYYEALLWAVENGITSGTSATTFSPDIACSRGQMAMFLYRSAKTPSVSGDNSFRDVSGTAYYNDAIIWAKAEGITAGTSATTFSPDDACTRSQMVTFLYRYLAE